MGYSPGRRPPVSMARWPTHSVMVRRWDLGANVTIYVYRQPPSRWRAVGNRVPVTTTPPHPPLPKAADAHAAGLCQRRRRRRARHRRGATSGGAPTVARRCQSTQHGRGTSWTEHRTRPAPTIDTRWAAAPCAAEQQQGYPCRQTRARRTVRGVPSGSSTPIFVLVAPGDKGTDLQAHVPGNSRVTRALTPTAGRDGAGKETAGSSG